MATTERKNTKTKKDQKSNAGRKSVYDTNVKPYFDYIKKWLVNGATEKQVAENLDIAYSSWNNFKTDEDKPEFMELLETIKKERITLVEDLKGALVKAALGYEYTEEKTYVEAGEDGKAKKRKETYKKYAAPNPTAIFGALNIYDEHYVNNKAAHKLKEKELDWKIQQAEKDMDNW